MERLWAPWRMEYIASPGGEGGSCVLCNAYAGEDDEANLVLYRGRLAFVIMNKFPYNSGHVMVVPNRHVSSPRELTDEEALEVHRLVSMSIEAIGRAMGPDGFNVGANLGRSAGAGLEHLHYHVVPRWNGDTNFMPVLADVKVIPEHLRATYAKLRTAIVEIARG